MEQNVQLEGLKCQGCVDRVIEEFSKLTGVDKVEVNLDTQIATLKTASKIDNTTLANALSDTKFSVIA